MVIHTGTKHVVHRNEALGSNGENKENNLQVSTELTETRILFLESRIRR